MATLKKPLISAAALASAAAVAVATPAIMPSNAAPSPTALSNARVNLTTFADLLSVTGEDWSNAYFDGWGLAISPNQDPDIDWAAAFVSPFTGCDFDCTVQGLSGIGYLALDALINGNGGGIEDSANWGVSALNYFFEGGPGSGVQYLVTQPFGDPASPVYNPAVATVIGQAFQGAINVTVLYVTALNTVAALAQNIPFVGPYIYGAIQAYLGPNASDEFFGDWGYFAGLSGLLRYALDVITTGGNPYPPYGPPVDEPAETSLAAAALPAAADAVDAVETANAAVDSDTEAAVSASDDTPAAEAPESTPAESTPAAEAPESTPAAEAPESTPAVDAPESTPAETTPAVDAPESTPVEPAVDVPAAEVAESAPAKTPVRAPKRPIRDAVEKVTKQITSAVGGSRTAKAGAASADTADAGAE